MILKVYEAYRECCDFSKNRKKSKDKVSFINNTEQQADRILYSFEHSKLLEAEKSRCVNKSKILYGEYCVQCRMNPGLRSEKLEVKLHRLMWFAAQAEWEKVQQFCRRDPRGEQVELPLIFEQKSFVRMLMRFPAERVIASYLERTHSCAAERAEDGDAGEDRVKVNPTITVFIDETIRDNPFCRLDEHLPPKQAMYSYVMCSGYLFSEKEISNNNTIDSGIGLVSEPSSQGVERVTQEAIGRVLFQLLYEHCYDQDVVIYIDNQSAAQMWRRNGTLRRISGLFHQVQVCFVPREENKAADRVGRHQTILKLPSDVIGKLTDMLDEQESLGKYKAYVEQYFPEPEKNIPNLIEELQDLRDVLRAANKGS